MSDDGVHPVLTGCRDRFQPGVVVRIGGLRLLSGRTGALIWQLAVGDVPEPCPR